MAYGGRLISDQLRQMEEYKDRAVRSLQSFWFL